MSDPRRIRLGMLRLTDAAPLIVAQERGLFRELGIAVELSVEPSWANVADKLSYGLLDGSVMLPPLALAVTLGSRGPATPLIVPLGLTLGGNSVTFAPALAEPLLAGGRRPGPAAAARRLAEHLAGRHPTDPPRLAVVHTLSTHNLLLRYWLASAGIDPDAAFEIVAVPPADMVDALEAGVIAGFCAGAPWGAVAARAQVGRMVTGTSGIWRHHPEKCLAVSRHWAERHPAALLALQRALLRAARICDDPAEAPAIARLLSGETYLGVIPAAIRASLPGATRRRDADPTVFFAHAATYPWISHALWFVAEMKRWGYIDAAVDARALATRVYRPDLYAEAARLEGISVPVVSSKPEGGHRGPWSLPALPAPIAMHDDLFCDGAVFAP
jgi:NitT/TauT family transport system ATP-binding protein/nitrate/nitrite transport system substrate-binding protein